MADEAIKPKDLQGLQVALEAAAEAEGVTVLTFLGTAHYHPCTEVLATDRFGSTRLRKLRADRGSVMSGEVVLRMTSAEVVCEQDSDA